LPLANRQAKKEDQKKWGGQAKRKSRINLNWGGRKKPNTARCRSPSLRRRMAEKCQHSGGGVKNLGGGAFTSLRLVVSGTDEGGCVGGEKEVAGEKKAPFPDEFDKISI